VRQERLGAVDHSPVVHVHHPFDVLELGDLDIPAEGDAGIVVDLVDLAEMALDLIGVEQERFPFGHVEPVGLEGCPGRGEPLGGGCQALGVDVADRHRRAGPSQLHGEFCAHARSGPGDDCDFASESLHGLRLAAAEAGL
jgi:hypothetical protein